MILKDFDKILGFDFVYAAASRQSSSKLDFALDFRSSLAAGDPPKPQRSERQNA